MTHLISCMLQLALCQPAFGKRGSEPSQIVKKKIKINGAASSQYVYGLLPRVHHTSIRTTRLQRTQQLGSFPHQSSIRSMLIALVCFRHQKNKAAGLKGTRSPGKQNALLIHRNYKSTRSCFRHLSSVLTPMETDPSFSDASPLFSLPAVTALQLSVMHCVLATS